MKIFSISDLHLSFSSDKPMDIFGESWDNYWEEIINDWQTKVTDNDIVLIAGDISWAMTLENALIDFKEIEKLNGKKIIIRGNHDYWWSSYNQLKNALKETNIFPIQNDSIKFDNYIFCGSRGWNIINKDSEQQDIKIFNRELIRFEMSLQDAKKKRKKDDKLIAMIHYPPFEATFGNTAFTDLFEKYAVDKVIYGHLHGKNCRAVKELEKNGIMYYLTSCDQVQNQLVRIY